MRREDRSGASSAEEDVFVLVVEGTLEDPLLIHSLLADELEHGVTLVQDGIRGCQLARHLRWSLVITNLNLPGRNGSEVIQASGEARADTIPLRKSRGVGGGGRRTPIRT